MKTISKSSSKGTTWPPVPKPPKNGKKWDEKKFLRWLRSIGAKPMDEATKQRLIKSGNWGMPDE
jgi:hypothetical protein